jgi:hypothetical protein
MVILVSIDGQAGQRGGDWVVETGTGREISRHRLKRRAKERARKEARKRNTHFRVQDTQGQWSQGPGF